MKLSDAYLRQREEWKQEGLQEGRRSLLKMMIIVRFGLLDEQAEKIRDRLLQLPLQEAISLIMQLTPEELLSRFGGEEESERDN